jgi:hypothetical protein
MNGYNTEAEKKREEFEQDQLNSTNLEIVVPPGSQ